MIVKRSFPVMLSPGIERERSRERERERER